MAIVNGTSGDDNLIGEPGADTIRAGNGNDVIDSGAGDDFVDGGVGDDIIRGGDGNDNLQGYAGSDTVEGGAGNDNVSGDEGNDVLRGGAGDDHISSTPFSLDTNLYRPLLDGGDGNDRLNVSGRAIATITGGAGNDTLSALGPGSLSGSADMGSGDDVVMMGMSAFGQTPMQVTLGGGADTVTLFPSGATPVGPWVIADFDPQQDKVSTISVESLLARWSGQNPFTTGHLALIQSGGDVVLRYDRDGGGDAYADLFRFSNLQLSQFSSASIFGFATDGRAPAGQTLVGGAGNDRLGESDSAEVGHGPDSLAGLGGDDVLVGRGGNDTIDGGAGNDIIYGLWGDDLVHGGDGADIIDARGFDRIYGEAGDDSLSISLIDRTPGQPTMEGGQGNDKLYLYLTDPGATAVARGDDGSDLISIDGAGAVTVDGGAGGDTIVARAADGAIITLGGGVDLITFDRTEPSPSRVTVLDFQAGVGGDRLDLTAYLEAFATGWDRDANPFGTGDARLVASGADTILQLKGANGYRDVAVLRNVAASDLRPENLSGYAPDGGISPGVSMTGAFGPDTQVGGPGADSLSGEGGSDSLSGAAGPDLLRGGDSADTLEGGAGGDTLEGGAGADSLLGGDGVDVVRGGDGEDYIQDQGTTDRIYGEGGGDTLFVSLATPNPGGELLVDGGDGPDRIFFSVRYFQETGGTARLVGGAGGDTINLNTSGPRARVIVDAGEGNDVIEMGGAGDYSITLGAGSDVIDIRFSSSGTMSPTVTDFNPAEDRIQFYVSWTRLAQQGSDVLLQVTDYTGTQPWETMLRLQNVSISALTSATFLLGGRPLDWRLGSAAADTLGVGADIPRVDGGAGADQIVGGAGDETLRGGADADSLSGDAGRDSLNGDAGDDNVSGGDGADTIVDVSGSNYLRGDLGDDRITGGGGFDDINGNQGDDTAAGGAGDDWVVGGKDNDRLSGDLGADIVYGNLGDDTIMGDSGADLVRGGQGNDSLSGGSENDWLSGDRGDDTVVGGPGADLFNTFGEAGIDRVLDFNAAQGDRVQVEGGASYTVAQVGADTVISMTGGGQMILVGVQMGSLPAGWIVG